MSPIGPENFYRLEEFPSFISCIKCFGKPIIPPLLTPSRRHELKQLQSAAINKEAEKLRIKNELLNCQKQEINISSKTCKDDYRSGFQSTMQESCALWYPSVKDCQEGISVAISKLPTSGIYSSVHTGAIVCSNVIENSHAYATAIMRDSLLDSEPHIIDCIECSHNKINLECSLCRAEYDQSFHNKSFMPEVSPEVPCRTFSLLSQSVGAINDDLNCSVDETECESLPTVICNQKFVPPDTDSESNITSMTQSTDLEKYMEFSYECNSPDNSTSVWDSKSTSQQYTLSRSDDASSETIVNTENELTPCASTMAELTDNIEDELSNADETAAISDKNVISGTLKRAHSVDSYMKIIQTCAKSMSVKKSLSDPFNVDLKTASGEEVRTPLSLKTSLLIKEDSKESEESKDIPERDVSDQGNAKEEISNHEKDSEMISNNTFRKKHIRQNSYTLDEPSSVLILAHADCTCNFDANCISPHCSALKDENEVRPNTAFTKEKVEIDIPVSHHQMKKLPILNSVNSSENAFVNEEGMTTLIDVFPIVREDCCEKSDSGNAQISESLPEFESAKNSGMQVPDREHDVVSEKFNSSSDKNQEYLQRICQELQESYKIRVGDLIEKHNKEWLRLQEDLKEHERFLYEEIKLSVTGSPSKVDKDSNQIRNDDYCNIGKADDNRSAHGKESSISNTSISSLDQNPTSDNSIIYSSELSVSSESCQSVHSPPKNLSPPKNARASVSPSTEFKTSNINPSKSSENFKNKQLFKESDSSITCNIKSNENHDYCQVSEPVQNINNFPCSTSSIFLTQCNSPQQPPTAVAVPFIKKCDTCICDNSVKLCKCCTSLNGYCEYDVNNSYRWYTPASQEQNSNLDAKDLNNDINFHHYHSSSSTSSAQGNNLNPRDSTNHFDANPPKENLSSSSKKSNDSISMMKTVVSASLNNLELSDVVNEDQNILSQSLKEKSKLSVNNNISSYKNVSVPQAATRSKKTIDDPVLLKKFEKLPAFVKGYLTRRLFKTERVESLLKTLRDTLYLVQKLSEDLPVKGDSVSERDVDFHRQLIVQLMDTYKNVYDVLSATSIKEKMAIIAESRNRRLKQKTKDQKLETDSPVTTKAPESAPSNKHKLSSATLKALERKRRSAIDSRTYTIEDFKNARSRSTIEMRTCTIDDLDSFRGRSQSNMSSRNISICKANVGMCIKRKTASAKSSGSRRCQHQKWVP